MNTIQLIIDQEKLQKQHCISVIGGGGKTSFCFALGDKFSKQEKTIVTTTTHMLYPKHLTSKQISLSEDIREIQSKLSSNLLFLEKPYQGKKLQSVSSEVLSAALSCCDKMIIEADGSRQYPLKFEKENEPAVPSFCECVIQIVGASAFHKKACETIHRYPLAKQHFQWKEDTRVDVSLMAQLITYNFNKTHAQQKIVIINQMDTVTDKHLLAPLKQILPYPVYFFSLLNDIVYKM